MARKDVDKRRAERPKRSREVEVTTRLLNTYQALREEAQKTTGDDDTFYVTTNVLRSPETIRDFNALVVDILWDQSDLTLESLQKQLYADCWKVFAILVWLRDWEVLEAYMRSVLKAKNPLLTFRDKNLPADGRTSPSFIVKEGLREQFRAKQWIFIPFEIETSLSEPVQQVEPDRRLPFEVVKPRVTALGAFGEIEKVIISGGYLKEGSKVELATTTLACKWLKYDARDDKEVENLKILKNFRTTHEHVVLHLAIIKQKLHTDRESSVRQGILFEWAALGDLEDFLNSGMAEDETQIYIFTSTMKDADLGSGNEHMFASHVFEQASKLASAVKWLHNGEGGKYVAHMDIKPRNILVCSPERGYPVGKWKLSDFGITHVRNETSEVALPHYLRKLGVPDFMPRAGTYQPPYQDRVSEESERFADVWALGCVLEELLAFAIGRTEAVRAFRESRQQQNRQQHGRGSDFFHYRTNDTHTRTEFDLQAFKVPQWAEFVRRTIEPMRAISPSQRPRMEIVITYLTTIKGHLRNWTDALPLPAADKSTTITGPAPEDSVNSLQSDELSTPRTNTPSQRSASLALSSQMTPSTTITRRSSTLPTMKDWKPKLLDLHSWLNSSAKQDIEVVAVAPNHDGKSVAVLTRCRKVHSVKVLSLHPTKEELSVPKTLTIEPLKITNATSIAYCRNVLCVWGTEKGAQLAIYTIDEAWTAHKVPVPELPSALNGLQHIVVTKSGDLIVLQCDAAILVRETVGSSGSFKSLKVEKGYHFKNIAIDPAGALLYAWAFAQGNSHDRLYMWSIQSYPPSAFQPPFQEYSRIGSKIPRYFLAPRVQPGEFVLWSGANDLYLATQASTSSANIKLGTGSGLKHILDPVLGIHLIRNDCLIVVGKEKHKGLRVYQHQLKASSHGSSVIGKSIADVSILNPNERQLHPNDLDSSIRVLGDDGNLDGVIVCFPSGKIFCLQPPR